MAKDLKNIMINHTHDILFLGYVDGYLSGRLIDIRCGAKPYKVFSHLRKRDVGIDHDATFYGTSDVYIFLGTAFLRMKLIWFYILGDKE